MEWRPAGWSECLPLLIFLDHKVQKFSSSNGSPGWFRKKGRKTVVVVVVCIRPGVWDWHSEDRRGGSHLSLGHGADGGTVQVYLRRA